MPRHPLTKLGGTTAVLLGRYIVSNVLQRRKNGDDTTWTKTVALDGTTMQSFYNEQNNNRILVYQIQPDVFLLLNAKLPPPPTPNRPSPEAVPPVHSTPGQHVRFISLVYTSFWSCAGWRQVFTDDTLGQIVSRCKWVTGAPTSGQTSVCPILMYYIIMVLLFLYMLGLLYFIWLFCMLVYCIISDKPLINIRNYY